MPLGRSRTLLRDSAFRAAHSAMAVGPLAPARTAMRAMTTTLTRGCLRLTEERGSSKVSKCRAISSRPIGRTSAIVHSPEAAAQEATRRMIDKQSREKSHPRLPGLPSVSSRPVCSALCDPGLCRIGRLVANRDTEVRAWKHSLNDVLCTVHAGLAEFHTAGDALLLKWERPAC